MHTMLYSIKYTNRLTGKRCSYMNIGFATPESAQRELDILLAESNKNKYTDQELQNIEPLYLRSWMIGIDWKIEPIKIYKNEKPHTDQGSRH